MKKYLLFPISILMFACGSETQPADESGEELTTEIEETEQDDTQTDDAVNEISYKPENADGKWQIDDYAEMFVGGKIYSSSEDLNSESDYGSSYYEKLDLAGGYARVTGAYEGWREFVLWRMEDGRDLLGTMSAGCGPACDYSFNFYFCNKEVTDKVEMKDIMPITEMDKHRDKMQKKALEKFPVDYPEDISYIFIFPQKGTSMEVDMMLGADEVHIPLLKLTWDKKKFNIGELCQDVKERTW